jgi:hypothetical protein
MIMTANQEKSRRLYLVTYLRLQAHNNLLRQQSGSRILDISWGRLFDAYSAYEMSLCETDD